MQLKNLLFQPLSLQLSIDSGGIHLNARECREVLAEQLSAEVQLAASRGLISLIEKADEGISKSLGVKEEATPDEAESVLNPDPQPIRKKGERR